MLKIKIPIWGFFYYINAILINSDVADNPYSAFYVHDIYSLISIYYFFFIIISNQFVILLQSQSRNQVVY